MREQVSKSLDVPIETIRVLCDGSDRKTVELVLKSVNDRTAQDLANELYELVHAEGTPLCEMARWAEIHGHVSEQVYRMVSTSLLVSSCRGVMLCDFVCEKGTEL